MDAALHQLDPTPDFVDGACLNVSRQPLLQALRLLKSLKRAPGGAARRGGLAAP